MSTNSTASKIHTLQAANEDFEFYPTTPEIMEAMGKDIFSYLRMHKNDYEAGRRGGKDEITIHEELSGKKKKESLWIATFLDIGSGDGRVLGFFEAKKNTA